jgi:hypothetical protein
LGLNWAWPAALFVILSRIAVGLQMVRAADFGGSQYR